MLKLLREFFFRGRRPKSANYFVSTASQSRDRIRRLGLSLPRMDGTALLDTGKLSIPVAGEARPQEFKPDPYLDWVIQIPAGERRSFAREDVYEMFDLSWRKQHAGVTIYGLYITDNRWTYAMAGDAPERFSIIQAAVDLLEYSGDLSLIRTELAGRMAAMASRVTGRIADAVVTESAGQAEMRRAELLRLQDELRADVLVVLKSDSAYPGLLVWEVLTGTGLQWGDGDLFHWDNPRRDCGDDSLFSVWTSTQPGYFFPEDIKAGRFNPSDLVFGYWIARSFDPLGVFEALITELEYCRQQLGGVLLARDGKPFDPVVERARLSKVVEALKAKGIRPGSHTALRMF